MREFSYRRLEGITKTEPPYRGSQNKYPFWGRKQSYYYFLREVVDGEVIFKVCNHYNWNKIEVSKDEYESRSRNIDYQVEHTWDPNTRTHVPTGKYFGYEKVPHVFGISRPDNTFTLTTEYMSQGERILFSRNTPGWSSSQVRRGGVIYEDRRPTQYMIPLTKGMKFDCDISTPIPIGHYQLFGHRVSRKGAKAELAKYEEFYRVSEAMMKNMPHSVFVDIAREALQRRNVDMNRYWMPLQEQSEWLESLDGLIDESPIDAAAFFCAAFNICRMWDASAGKNVYREDPLEYIFSLMRRRINEYLYHNRSGILVPKEYEFGKVFPQSHWNYEVRCDGVKVEQY